MAKTLDEIFGVSQKQNTGTLDEEKKKKLDEIFGKTKSTQKQVVNQPTVKEQPTPEQKPGAVESVAKFLAPKAVEGFGATLGDALAANSKDVNAAFEAQSNLQTTTLMAAKKIKELRAEGKDTSRLENIVKQNLEGTGITLEQLVPSSTKSKKEIAGEALGTFNTVLLGSGAGAVKKTGTGILAGTGKLTTQGAGTALGRIGLGTALGGSSAASESLRKDRTGGEIATDIAKGAATGAVVSAAFEGLGKLIRTIRKRPGSTFDKELQPATKDLTRQFEKNWKTFGQKVSEVTDDAGKPLYKGSYETMKKQAQKDLNKSGNALKNLAKQKYSNTFANRNEVAGDIIEKMQNEYGRLKPSQLKQIQFEVNKIPNKLNVPEMIDKKRMFDGNIPKNFWANLDDPNKAFVGEIRYILRDNLRKTINDKTKDATIKALNERMGIAMDVRHLAAAQQAIRQKLKISATGGIINKTVGRFIDDVLLNPAITTRASHLRNQPIGSTAARKAIRNVATESAGALTAKPENKRESQIKALDRIFRK